MIHIGPQIGRNTRVKSSTTATRAGKQQRYDPQRSTNWKKHTSQVLLPLASKATPDCILFSTTPGVQFIKSHFLFTRCVLLSSRSPIRMLFVDIRIEPYCYCWQCNVSMTWQTHSIFQTFPRWSNSKYLHAEV